MKNKLFLILLLSISISSFAEDIFYKYEDGLGFYGKFGFFNDYSLYQERKEQLEKFSLLGRLELLTNTTATQEYVLRLSEMIKESSVIFGPIYEGEMIIEYKSFGTYMLIIISYQTFTGIRKTEHYVVKSFV